MIGSALVSQLVEQGNEVFVVDNLWRGNMQNLYDQKGLPFIDLKTHFFQYDLIQPDVCDHIFKDQAIDFVYHLADVVAGVDYVFRNEGLVFRHNLLINSNIIDTVKRYTLKGFIYVGTACSFPAHLQSGLDSRPLRESDQYPASPESAYGWSKLIGEYESFLLEKEYRIPVSVLTLHNVYGQPCDFSPEKSQAIPALIRKAVRYPEEDFIVWGSGEQGRDFIYIDDVVDALLLAKDRGLGQGLIQIGSEKCTSIMEIAENIIEISGKDINLKFDTSKPEGDRGRSADCTKAKQVLGWHPKVDKMDGLKKLYLWIDEQINVK